MKPAAVLINVARGPVAVEEDLYEALAAGVIGGAVLDAWYGYPQEDGAPVAASRFRFDLLPTVRCTPHASAWSEGLIDRRYDVIADNITRLAEGRPLRNVVKAGA
jgi:phosphoglycerate dehydrogenase-like enzyme